MDNELKVCFGVFRVHFQNLSGGTSIFLQVVTEEITINEKIK